MTVDEIWVEKYRPKTLEEMVGNAPSVDKLRGLVLSGSVPNLIVTGPPGCGKTTSGLCVARALLGEQYFASGFLELNASDDRGIDVVRTRVKGFAQHKVTLPEGKFKIILLDEADSMTEGAQQALRRVMELYSNSTRFILSCNVSSKLIEPIQSRCAVLRFTRITNEEVKKRLIQISGLENFALTEDGANAIVETSDGDMRQAMNNLQSCHTGFGTVTSEAVYRVCDVPQPETMRKIIASIVSGDNESACAEMKRLHVSEGHSSSDILSAFQRALKTYQAIAEALRIEFFRISALTQVSISSNGLGSNMLQLNGMVGKMCLSVLALKKSQAASASNSGPTASGAIQQRRIT